MENHLVMDEHKPFLTKSLPARDWAVCRGRLLGAYVREETGVDMQGEPRQGQPEKQQSRNKLQVFVLLVTEIRQKLLIYWLYLLITLQVTENLTQISFHPRGVHLLRYLKVWNLTGHGWIEGQMWSPMARFTFSIPWSLFTSSEKPFSSAIKI